MTSDAILSNKNQGCDRNGIVRKIIFFLRKIRTSATPFERANTVTTTGVTTSQAIANVTKANSPLLSPTYVVETTGGAIVRRQAN